MSIDEEDFAIAFQPFGTSDVRSVRVLRQICGEIFKDKFFDLKF